MEKQARSFLTEDRAKLAEFMLESLHTSIKETEAAWPGDVTMQVDALEKRRYLRAFIRGSICRNLPDPAVNRIRFAEPARHEVLAEVGYQHRDEAGLESKFLEAVEEATARALTYPLAGSPAQHRTRRMLPMNVPFALADHARRSSNWRSHTDDR